MANVVVMWEEDFPFVDTPPLTRPVIQEALAGHAVTFAPTERLAAALASAELLVTPYGSAFPMAAWPAISEFLRGGGHWLSLGGSPFSRPVRSVAGHWRVECEQRSYAKELLINHGFEVECPPTAELADVSPMARLAGQEKPLRLNRAWTLQFRFTRGKDFPDEMGSGGPREARLQPVLQLRHRQRVLAAPVVCVDRLAGPCAGGRWVLFNAEAAQPLPPGLIGALAETSLQPVITINVRPSFACYFDGDRPRVNVTIESRQALELAIKLQIRNESGQTLGEQSFNLKVGDAPAGAVMDVPQAVAPGLYHARATCWRRGEADVSRPLAVAENGFWIHDDALMASGPALTVNNDYFLLEGKPLPVTGTTYMSGDTHRKFLFEPNPAVWDADFAAMKAAGVNMIRTGLWTGWKRIMLDNGALDEGVLRAMGAFLLTAARHRIPIIFNVFSFTNEDWAAGDSLLDEDAFRAQASFVGAFARRFASANHLLWDYNNEPSYGTPSFTWASAPRDAGIEQSHWRRWLAESGVDEDEWRLRWRLTPNDALSLPGRRDFQDRDIFQRGRQLAALEYRLFAQEMFAHWCRRLGQVIRANGNEHQLRTVGQDEGGARDRACPWFYGPAVDFTCNHSWWLNDDLLWDSLITKTPTCPNLLEETGIMFLETVDGLPGRTLQECRNLLERKMALAFAGGCAGFIQWLWNTNVYMDSDNEAAIGFLHADGSEKPELEAFRGVARFFEQAAPHMAGRRDEEVVIVIPHSLQYSVRDLSSPATKRAVRTLEYRMGVTARTVSEYRGKEIGRARLIILPAPRVIEQECWNNLLACVSQGATLLLSGFMESDPFWRPAERLASLGVATLRRTLAHEETVKTPDGRTLAFTFTAPHPSWTPQDGHQHRAEKAVAADGSPLDLQVIPCGAGRIIYCPVPAELSQDEGQAEPLYRLAAALAGVKCAAAVSSPGLLVRPVHFAAASLYLLVNETNLPRREEIRDEDGRWSVSVETQPQRIALAMIDRQSGHVLCKYEPA